MHSITRGHVKAEQASSLEKTCSKCKVSQSLDCYYVFERPDGKQRVRSMCKRCYIAGQTAYYEKNKRYYKKKSKEWYLKHADRIKKYRLAFLERNPGYMQRYNKAYREKARSRKTL